MPLAQLRKIFLWSFIGFLTVTALIAVVCLFGRDFGELQLKVLATTFTISAASICAMACAAFIEKRGSRPWGFAGLLLATAAAAFTVLGIWMESDSDSYWKVTVTLIVVSLAFTHALLLHIPTLSPAYRWTRVIAVVLVSALVIELIYVIFNVDDNHEDIFRLIAATSVFVVLLTLVIPICAKLGGSNQKEAGEKLVLEKISDGVFTDPSGRKYRVTTVENE
jgi:hypothetical protein